MPVSSSSLFPALSLVSVLLAGSAVYLAQQQPEAIPVQTRAPFDPSGLERSISVLVQEMKGLQSKLDSMGKTVSEQPDSSTEPENEQERIQFRARETERITAAVEAMMETRGVELAQNAQRQRRPGGGRGGCGAWGRQAAHANRRARSAGLIQTTDTEADRTPGQRPHGVSNRRGRHDPQD